MTRVMRREPLSTLHEVSKYKLKGTIPRGSPSTTRGVPGPMWLANTLYAHDMNSYLEIGEQVNIILNIRIFYTYIYMKQNMPFPVNVAHN